MSRGAPRSAAEWFAIMRGPDADRERAAFEEWRKLEDHADAFARLEATWDESYFLANRPAGQNRDLTLARRRGPPGALLAAGIALLILVSASLLVHQTGWLGQAPAQKAAGTQIAAGDAVRTVSLSDGSRAVLDRGAVLDDLGTQDERRFILLRGRARFDVVHDAARPFFVDAGAGRVIAHGTVFDVGIESGVVNVTLLKGSVEVRERRRGASHDAARRRFLAPGEQLLVRAGTIEMPTRAAAASLAWPEPMISFDAVPLAEAVAAFNRSSGRRVRLEGEGLSALRVSGAFRRDDPQGFADGLAASFGLHVEPAGDGGLILRAGG